MAKGDVSQTVSVEAQGELKAMAENVNSSTQQTADALDDILRGAALSEGGLTRSISASYKEKFSEVSTALIESHSQCIRPYFTGPKWGA